MTPQAIQLKHYRVKIKLIIIIIIIIVIIISATWYTFPASEHTISEHPHTYVVPVIYKAVSRKVDQNKCTYARMPKGSVGHIPYIFVKT